MDSTFVDAVVVLGSRRIELSLLLDSEQMYTCLPEPVWRELGLSPVRSVTVSVATGLRSCDVAICTFELFGDSVTTPVILGGPEDVPILGELTLSELGFVLDPPLRRLSRGVFPMMSARPSPTMRTTHRHRRSSALPLHRSGEGVGG